MQTETEEVEIKARIAELRTRYAKLAALCRFGVRVNRETLENYAQEIESLQNKLN